MNEDTLCEIIHALLSGLGSGERTASREMSPLDPASGGCIHWLYDLGTDELDGKWVVPGYDDGSLRPYLLRFDSDSGCNFVEVREWPESTVADLLGRLLSQWEFPERYEPAF